MRTPLLVLALLLVAQVAAAQNESHWRVGVLASAPSKVLEVNSLTLPDSNDSRVSLGIGFGAEAGRGWRLSDVSVASLLVRIVTASVTSEVGGGDWSPGRALIADVTGRLERSLNERFSFFGGVGVSHWRGPDGTSPFAGAGAALVSGEAGIGMRPAAGAWRVDLTGNITRFGSDDERNVATGFVWRWMLGVYRDR
jgi:hypothetical protein